MTRKKLQKLQQDGTSIPLRSRFYDENTQRIFTGSQGRIVGKDIDKEQVPEHEKSTFLAVLLVILFLVIVGMFLYACMWAGMHLGHFFGMVCQP